MKDWFPANSDGRPGFEPEPPENNTGFEEWGDAWGYYDMEG